jgi:hypothetical protein
MKHRLAIGLVEPRDIVYLCCKDRLAFLFFLFLEEHFTLFTKLS